MRFRMLKGAGMVLLLLAGSSGVYGAEPAVPRDFVSTSFYSESGRFFSSGGGESETVSAKSESTLCFNDGFGRLTEFHMTWENHRMVLVVRQNMNVIGRKSCYAEEPVFSVVREETEGHTYFLITMGDSLYRGEIDRDNHWTLTEEPAPGKEKNA